MRGRRRILRFGLGALVMSTAACSAIAGLDGNFELGEAGDGSTVNPDGTSGTDGSSGNDGKVPTDGGSSGNDDTGTDGGGDATSDADANVEPPDACANRSFVHPPDLGDAATFAPATGTCTPNPFCFDFNGDVNASPYGWDGVTVNGGTVQVLPTTINIPARHLVATASISGADAGAQVWIRDWNSGPGPDPQPLLADAGAAVVLAFSFMLEQATRQADLMQLQVGSSTYGLTVYPDPCGGDPRIAQSGLDVNVADFKAAQIQTNKWYRGEVHFNHQSNGTWNGEVFVGTLSVGTRANIFPAGMQKELPAAILGGLINLGATGTSKVNIDDMIMVRQAAP